MKQDTTERGFALQEFRDHYGEKCSLQQSSLATENAIWLGIQEMTPRILASKAIQLGIDTQGQTTGWVDYPLPYEVFCSTRMHLTQAQVGALLPYLLLFVETGSIT